jgi:hypothetical protein
MAGCLRLPRGRFIHGASHLIEPPARPCWAAAVSHERSATLSGALQSHFQLSSLHSAAFCFAPVLTCTLGHRLSNPWPLFTSPRRLLRWHEPCHGHPCDLTRMVGSWPGCQFDGRFPGLENGAKFSSLCA